MTKRLTELIADVKSRYTDAAIRDGFKRRDASLCRELREIACELNPRWASAPPWVLEWKAFEHLLSIHKDEIS